ncbi:Chloramphenicol acetyltransferase-like domain-containing protein [Cynara cardunculus var. scolymus]|uniref:Chloramphenicol acetyltransferase-like domain-containing protein n=1 Tax=Cynara cardunculus var. scolymus TaxID=59895 RepID=A0A103XPM9_CYNCS|nr:Chloramphenicol acetyltransferase-like domain-containing protein [Cynara cardunculus var. scolymus]
MEELCVAKSSGSLVPPCAPTPPDTLHLSRIDRLPALRCNARTLHVFEALGPPGAAQSIILQALSKALVPYYPLAGRLISNPPQVQCSGEGVWFVEASANCTLQSVAYFEDVTSIPFDKLLPHHPPQTQAIDPLVLMQVTEFEGDGFVMGLTFCHTICDGLGAAQFLNAIAEFARGAHQLTISPVWHRDFLPQPQTITSCTPPPANFMLPPADYELEQANIDIPLHHINQLKQQFLASTFEIVAAILWRNRTKAISLGSSENRMMKLVFFANCRHLVQPPLPKGFYGNCFFPVTISAYSDTLSKAEMGEVVKMIQEAKANLGNEFADWVSIKKEEKEDPFAPPLGYGTLFVSEWGKLGFNQVDYGKGEAVHVVPMQGSSIIPVAIVGTMPRPNKGIRVMTWTISITSSFKPIPT